MPVKRLHRDRSPGVAGVIVLGIVLLGVIGWGVANFSRIALSPSQHQRDARSIVMVSGRDDHGHVQDKVVPLISAPDDDTVVARVADGTFVRVVEQRGEWMRVQTVAAPQATGWVNDYYLRNRMLRTDGGGQVELLDAREMGGRVWLYVQAVSDPAAEPIWMDSMRLKEIGAHADE
ncbi:MAG TPA: SH3 domain-containing protein [Chloroflexia bacterium]|nr:SH3 domain-containing protein [Chloroflexia bacterium]